MALQSWPALDGVDWQLVEFLQDNARLSFAELGRRLGLSSPAVTDRVRRLELAGVISGYHAHVHPDRLGLPMQAVVRIVTTRGEESLQMGERLKQVPEVLECHRVTGADSHVVRVAVRSVGHLDEVLSRIRPASGDTITAIVLDTPVPFRAVGRAIADGADPERRSRVPADVRPLD